MRRLRRPAVSLRESKCATRAWDLRRGPKTSRSESGRSIPTSQRTPPTEISAFPSLRLVLRPPDLPVEEHQLIRDLPITLGSRRADAVAGVEIDSQQHGPPARSRGLQAGGHLTGLPRGDARVVHAGRQQYRG